MPSRLLTRRRTVAAGLLALLSGLFGAALNAVRPGRGPAASRAQGTSLPEPRRSSDVSVEAAIAGRRSRREYADESVALAELGQLLWAAQGVTERRTGHRAAPSAGATYPLEVYAAVGAGGVDGLDAGVYRYRPADHALDPVRDGDVLADLQAAAVDQEWVGAAALNLVVAAFDERTTGRYGDRGRLRYVPMEAGHAAENVALQAESLGLSTVTVGAFVDDRVLALAGIPEDRRPLYLLPVGRRPTD